MYNVDAYLKSLTSNAVKLSKKVQDGIAENTRDFRLENQAHFLDTNDEKMRYHTSQRLISWQVWVCRNDTNWCYSRILLFVIIEKSARILILATKRRNSTD